MGTGFERQSQNSISFFLPCFFPEWRIFSPICRILTVFGLELYLIIREGSSVTGTRLLLTIHYAVAGNDRCDQISVREKLTLF